MTPEFFESFTQFVSGLLAAGNVNAEHVEVRKDGQSVRVDLSFRDAGLAIGPNGEHLRAWGEVFERWATKQLDRFVPVTVDINNYRWQADESLRELARRAAKEATFTRHSVKLPAMNAYERRVVHAELALRPDVHTESEGQDPNRCVVVKPLL